MSAATLHTKKPAHRLQPAAGVVPTPIKEQNMSIVHDTTDTVNVEVCTRPHCDAARDGIPHERNVDGEIMHKAVVDADVIDLGSAGDATRWEVALIAWGNHPWTILVRQPGRDSIVLANPAEAKRFAAAASAAWARLTELA